MLVRSISGVLGSPVHPQRDGGENSSDPLHIGELPPGMTQFFGQESDWFGDLPTEDPQSAVPQETSIPAAQAPESGAVGKNSDLMRDPPPIATDQAPGELSEQGDDWVLAGGAQPGTAKGPPIPAAQAVASGDVEKDQAGSLHTLRSSSNSFDLADREIEPKK